MNNIVSNFGSNSTKGIYQDDESSWQTVQNNIVVGPGTYGVMIHGGNNDVVKNNVFDVSNIQSIGFYQDDYDDGSGSTNYGMAGNVFSNNVIYSSGNVPAWTYLVSAGMTITPPTDTDNMYYSGSGVYNENGTPPIVDTQPVVANPLFVNPGTGNYALQTGSPVSQVGFVPIDTSTIGPIVP
jgi:hypothetical protein